MWQFTERGHIFVKVHLAEHAKGIKDTKDEKFLNGGSDDMTSACKFRTLSGYEAADDRNCWDAFKNLIANEDLRSNASVINMTNHDASDDVTLMVCVEDTGIGIPYNAQDRIFMPFVQADSSTSRHYGGTGIGLSISKCLVELMRGQINFVSRPDIGSTFSFSAVFGRYDRNGVKKPISEDLPSGFRGLKAVVVDAKPVRAAVTRYHLKRLGMTVDVAGSIKLAGAVNGKNGST